MPWPACSNRPVLRLSRRSPNSRVLPAAACGQRYFSSISKPMDLSGGHVPLASLTGFSAGCWRRHCCQLPAQGDHCWLIARVAQSSNNAGIKGDKSFGGPLLVCFLFYSVHFLSDFCNAAITQQPQSANCVLIGLGALYKNSDDSVVYLIHVPFWPAGIKSRISPGCWAKYKSRRPAAANNASLLLGRQRFDWIFACVSGATGKAWDRKMAALRYPGRLNPQPPRALRSDHSGKKRRFGR